MTASHALAHEHPGPPNHPEGQGQANGHLTPPTETACAMNTPIESHEPNGSNGIGYTQDDETQTLPPSPIEDSLAEYVFPDQRLKKVMEDSSKEPILLVACGSFSPITYLHLRMFEMVADHVKFSTNFEIVGGYLSPVSDAYKKVGLASAEHRINMCAIAAEETSAWLTVDPWEALRTEYTRTALVLDHFDHEINGVRGGVGTANGERKHVRVALLAGADLIGTMSTPGVWSAKDLDHILGRYGAFIVERTGTDIDEALANLEPWKHNIFVIPQPIHNDVSSTKIRSFLKKEMSVRYLIPAPVIQYIEQHGLYEDETSLHRRAKSGDTSLASPIQATIPRS